MSSYQDSVSQLEKRLDAEEEKRAGTTPPMASHLKSTPKTVAPKKPAPAPKAGKGEPAGKSKAQGKAAPPEKSKAQRGPQKGAIAGGGTLTQMDDPAKRKKAAKQQVVELRYSAKQVALFSHLPQYEAPESVSLSVKSMESLHPAIVQLGVAYAERRIVGSTARTLAMLDAFARVLGDYQCAPDKPMALDLELKFRPLIQFLSDCRPLGVGMGNAIKTFKRAIGRVRSEEGVDAAKAMLLDVIERYREQKVIGAGKVLAETGAAKIRQGDVLLTFGHSHAVLAILRHARENGTPFRVVVLDAAPRYEGRTLLRALLKDGVACTYALLTGAAYALKGVTKVLLGAHALLANGSVLARTGTAVVALLARSQNVPVLVACETHKFHERVQIDAITHNELEDPRTVLGDKAGVLDEWDKVPALKLLSVAYDLTPPENVDVVVTEVGLLPPTSVPVVLREAQHRSEE